MPQHPLPGHESYSEVIPAPPGLPYVQYDYRTHDGILFSTVAETLDQAQNQLHYWLKYNAPSAP